MKYLIFTSFLLTIFLMGCSSQNQLSQYEGTEIVFGNGGGVSGQVTEFTLNTAGQIVLKERIGSQIKSVADLKKSTTKKIYSQLSDINFSNINFNHPGNLYYFIREVKGDKTHEIVWGSPSQQVPSSIKEFYDYLMSNVSTR